MVVLFVLFPRIGPLWGVPQDGDGRRPACRARMRLGWRGRDRATTTAIALRIRFDGDRRRPPQALYFRGPVLSRFDGREWRRRA